MTIQIIHTAAEGTLVHGTTRGDGTNTILKSAGFRWFRTLGLWGIAGSRDRQANRYKIDQAAAALRGAGHTVTVDVDNTHRPTAAAEAGRAHRQSGRAEALADKAERAAAAAETAWDKEEHAASLLPPMGQPIYLGTSGGRRVLRNVERAHAATRRAIEATDDAREAARRAGVAAATTAHRYNPETVKNRIDKMDAAQRADQRALDGHRRVVARTAAGDYVDEVAPAEGGHRERLVTRMAQRADEIAYWKTVYESQQASGIAGNYSRDTISPGDLVKRRGHWYPVVRVNAKSVSVRLHEGASWTTTIGYHELAGHRSIRTPESGPAAEG